MGEFMALYNPPHPGELLWSLCIEPLGLTITAVAKSLGISRKTLSEVINGKSSITPEMAIRLSLAFNNKPEMWLNHQQQYDLWKARNKLKKIKVERLAA
jgi:addiction module HigA family antidote